jgi:DNA-binding XRE family transcriptional regulator
MTTEPSNAHTTDVQVVTLAGRRFVILPESEYRRVTGGLPTSEPEPMLPHPDAKGDYPAVEALRASMAQRILRRRRAAGLTQVELARRAGIRPETLNRLEQGKHTPTVATVEKIVRALERAEAG